MNVSAFIPIDRRRALLTGRDLPDRTHGAALFVDIAGFTAMTEMLMQQFGRQEGAEAVLHYLNPINDTLIAELHRFGGSVIGFAGDSITCWLDEDDGRRAVQCGLAMQRLMAQMDMPRLPQREHLSLGIKVAIAVGAARRFVVGTEANGFVDVLAGQTVLRMAAAESHAHAGDVVIDIANCASLLPDLIISAWRDDGRVGVVTALNIPLHDLAGCHLLPDEWQLRPEQARAWLHEPVFERLQMSDDFLAELRPATALFLKFEGIDFDNEDAAGQQLDQFIQWVQAQIKQLSGYLIQLTFGDKGSYLYIAFGAPRSSQNDESRAVTLGIALRSATEQFPFLDSVRIGISAGRMWTGAYGSQTRATYGVMGNETNMAARLMSEAQAGEVLVSESVYRRVNQRFAFESRGTLLLKGSGKPTGVWTVREQRNQAVMLPRFPYRLVGREQTLAQLATHWEDVKAGRGQTVKLSGDSGIGKSHLAVAFAEKCIEGITLWGSADSYTQYTAYSAWREIFARLLGVVGQIDSRLLEAIRPKLQQLDLADDMRLPLLGDLFGVSLADNKTTANFKPQVRQSSLYALLGSLVQRTAAQEPLLIVLDNAQWLDEVSMQLADELAFATAQRPVMILQLSRTVSADDTVTLSALNRTELRQLVTDRLGEPVTPLLLDILEIQTAGNPFFVEASLSAMREAGQIAYEETVWGVTDKLHEVLVAARLAEMQGEIWRLVESADLTPINVELPDTVHASILNRLDQLSEQNKLTLKVASVIGKQFDLDLLRRAHPQNSDHKMTSEEVDECVEQGFVRSLDNHSYAFQQNTVQEVTYSTLLFAQRRQLHAAVAATLSHPDYAHDYTTEMVAAHAYEGQDWSLAAQAYQQLGREAKDLHASELAIFAYQRAVEAAEKNAEINSQQMFAIRLALGNLYRRIGKYELALPCLETARGLASSSSQLVSVCYAIARTYMIQARYDEALTEITTLSRDRQLQGEEELLKLHLLIARIHLRRGDYQVASKLFEEILPFVKDGKLQVDYYAGVGWIQLRRGNLVAALEAFEQVLSYNELTHNRQGYAISLIYIADVYTDQARYTEAEQLFQDALSILMQLGDRPNQAVTFNHLGLLAHAQGQYWQALDYFDKALHVFPQINLHHQADIHLDRASTFVQLNRFTESWAEFDRAEQLFEQSGVRFLLPKLYRERAKLALRLDDFEAANRLSEQSLAVAHELAMQKEIELSAELQQKILATQSATYNN